MAAAQVRAEVSEHNGVAVIVKAMKHWASSGGVQCNGCLAIVSLVRAESKVCQVRLTDMLSCYTDMPSGAMLILRKESLELHSLQLAMVADHRRRRTVVHQSSALCSSVSSKERKKLSSCTASWRFRSPGRLYCC